MSILSYFKPANNESLFGEALHTSNGEVSSIQVCVARELNATMQDGETKKKRQIVPAKVKQEVGFYANKYGIPAARKWASDQYKNFEFKRETVRDWKKVYFQKYVNNEASSSSVEVVFKCSGRPGMIDSEMTTDIKSILQNLRTAGCAISRKTTIAVGTGVLQSKCPEVLAKNGGSINLTTKWARGILKSMEWSKRRGTTAKREMNPALYNELTFSWKIDIANLVVQHSIPEELIFNLDQTPLALVSASKVTMAPTGSHTVNLETLNMFD